MVAFLAYIRPNAYCIKFKCTNVFLKVTFPPWLAPWGWPAPGGAVLYRLSPQLGEDPPCWGPGVMWSSGRTGVAQLVARSTPDWCVVGSSPTCGTEHFGFPPSAPRLGNQRPWYVQPRLCDWAYKRSCATYRKEKGFVSRWSVFS